MSVFSMMRLPFIIMTALIGMISVSPGLCAAGDTPWMYPADPDASAAQARNSAYDRGRYEAAIHPYLSPALAVFKTAPSEFPGPTLLKVSFTRHPGARKLSLENPLGVPASSQSAIWNGKLLDERIAFRTEYSRPGTQTAASDEFKALREGALRTDISGKEGAFTWGISTQQQSPAPKSAKSAHILHSRIDHAASSLSLQLVKSRDYRVQNALQSTEDSKTGTIIYRFAKQGLPSLSANYTLRAAQNVQADGSSRKAASTGRFLSLDSNYAKGQWSIAPSYSVKRQQESARLNKELDTHTIKIASGIAAGDGIIIAPEFSYSAIVPEHAQARRRIYASSIHSTLKLIAHRIDIKTSVCCSESQAADKSVDKTAIIAKGWLDWSLDQALRLPGRKTMSLGAKLVKEKDRIQQATHNTWVISAGICIAYAKASSGQN